MTLSDFSIKNPVFAWMLMLGLILFGFVSLQNIGISELPDADFPVVTVNVTYRGAAPDIMESDIVDVIEESVMTVQGIKSVSSVSKQETASISIEFELSRDIDLAVQEVQTKIAQAQQRLPDDMDTPVVIKANPEDQPIMWVSVSADRPVRELNEFARDHIKDKLQTVLGVGEVIMSGYIEPNLRIWIDPKKLDANELTVQDVLSAIAKEHVEVPVGRIETATTEFNLRYLGEAKSTTEFENILVTRRGGRLIYQPLRIGDVAKVELGLDEIRRLSRTGGKPSIGLGIKKQRGANSVAVADKIKARLEAINQILPPGYSMQVNFDTTNFIRHSINEMKFELTLSAILTGVVCFLFLASINSTFNILMAIPTSIVGCFIFMGWLGFTLNNFTLLALTLAIGIVVDDAIMVLENIVRHQEEGKPPLRAARDGAREISSAAIATTISLIAIFAPVVFMKGVIGKFFYQFGMVLSITVALSLLEAVTLTPMRSSRMKLAQGPSNAWVQWTNKGFQRLAGTYHKALSFCLQHRVAVMVISLSIFVASLAIVPSLKKEFVPAQDQSGFLIMATAPLGSSIDFTSDKMKLAETIVAKTPELQRYFVAVGGFGGGEVNKAIMFVSLKMPGERPKDQKTGKILKQDEIMNRMREQLKSVSELTFIFQDLSLRGFTAQRGFPIEFSVRGPAWDKLTALSEQLIIKMKASESLRDVDTDYQFGQPEVQITPLRAAAAEHGVRIEDIGLVINAMIGGIRQGKFTENGHRNDIRVRVISEHRQTAEAIKKLFVRNEKGELVRLSEVVQVTVQKTLQSITRKDRERAIGVFANVAEGQSQEKALADVTRLAKETLPEGYRLVLGGSAEAFKETGESLMFALYMGIIIAYMVLASQYNSFIHPLIVLLALPFSLTGAFVFLKLFDQSLNLYSFIGVILLMGIAKKNSILLVDFINQKRREGIALQDAILISAPQRLRPILMTSITIIAAAVPSALGLGQGSEVRIPMSVVIMGGAFVSTIMTLFVIPCAYSLMARFERVPTDEP
jgi:HAE1 family hydrophobic/amphiphilic exporter-1